MRRHRGSHLRNRNCWEQIVPALCLLTIPALSLAGPVLQYEGGLATGSPLVRPSSVSLAPGADAVCVTDDGSRTLDVFDERGFHHFRTNHASGLFAPRDGSIDAEGRFVFLETGGQNDNTILRLSFFGEPEPYRAAPPTEGWTPLHLTIAIDGNYLTVDHDAVLTKHDASTGDVLWTLRLLEGDSERADLTGRPAQAADGTIYVPVPAIRQVVVVSPEGTHESSFGVPGTKVGELAFPVGVAVTGAGQILVLDRMRHSILVYSEDHEYLGESGRIGRGPGDLYHPIAIAASLDGQVYVAQGFEARVQRFRLLDLDSARKNSGS